MAGTNKKRNVSLNTEKFDEIERITTGRTFGIDQDFLNQMEEDRNRVKESIKNVNRRHTEISGTGMIEFFTSMVYEDNIKNSKDNKNKTISTQHTKTFTNLLDSTNMTNLSNMFSMERERISLYNEYESIINYIPQVYQALEAMTDAILSPDDYSKKVLNAVYNGSDNPDLEDHKLVIKNFDRLESKYKIEEKLKKLIFKSLYMGDSFILVSSLKKEFDKILTESTDETGEIKNESVMLNRNSFDISNEELSVFKELFLEDVDIEKSDNKNKKNNDIPNDNELKAQIIRMINQNVEYSTNSNSLIEKELKIAKEFKLTPVNSDYDSIINKTIKNNTDTNSSPLLRNVDSVEKLRHRTMRFDNLHNSLMNNGNNKKVKETDITGSYIKELQPERLVKLTMGSTCFGYFYIETDLTQRQNTSSFSPNTRISDFKLRQAVDITTANIEEELNNPKIKLITDVFGRALSNKVNKKFIEDNREFKTLIYELLKNDYITKKRVRIVYLEPSEVIHFAPDLGEDGYGISKLSKILFTCKIYIATLVTNLMMKLSRSADHRAFYIETGLSKDLEATVQSFMRDIKSKEVRLNDLQTVDTIFRSIGQLDIVDFKIY